MSKFVWIFAAFICAEIFMRTLMPQKTAEKEPELSGHKPFIDESVNIAEIGRDSEIFKDVKPDDHVPHLKFMYCTG